MKHLLDLLQPKERPTTKETILFIVGFISLLGLYALYCTIIDLIL
jgi:F0F1-type ATP synthase membrane subunit c/vacuolar-type H+-ATPase subunit K